MPTRFLDLNTRNTLAHWTVIKALTELLANALDEATESETEVPSPQWEDNVFILRDAGRGLKVEHFQQHINPKKREDHSYIGKHGVGLKDSLAVLFNNDKKVTLESKYLYAKGLVMRPKDGFDEEAIHVRIKAPRNKKFIGTTITVQNITSKEYREACNNI